MSRQAMSVFSTAFKESAVLRLAAGERLAEVAKELGIARKLLYEWRAAAELRFSARGNPVVRSVRS
jgi:transposase-like protein